MAFSFVVGVIGGLLLMHAAYSTIQYRAVLKITEEKFSAPPFNVFLEVITGLSLCLWAGLAVPGKFLSILTVSEDNRLASLPGNLDFMIFNHRGKVVALKRDLKFKC
ncbi:membrane magnesium transporter [Nymphaea colorata]|nr:membrane magnesium transporter [Nymphaea colorata]XP_031491344.1 membrane magnesium transporter [Nymphaea colorata]XP_031491345.1 membrane magnesium transporter [Nymphaea colorata]